MLLREQFVDPLQCVDFADHLVRPRTHDARKPQRISAFVAFGFLYVVEGHFNDQLRFDNPTEALIFERMFEKEFCVLRDFNVRKSRVGFADVEQSFAVTYGKGDVGEHFVAFTMAVFRRGDGHIQRGVGLFQFYP